MQVMYLKGERVYVERGGLGNLDPNQRMSLFSKDIQIVKHADIVRAFNCLFQYAEEHPKETESEYENDLMYIIHRLNESKHESHKIRVDIADPENTWFDDERKVKLVQRAKLAGRVKEAELHQEEKVVFDHKYRIIKGGLYQAGQGRKIATEGLSKEFIAFLKKERCEEVSDHTDAQPICREEEAAQPQETPSGQRAKRGKRKTQ